ncbi:ABC transporter permease [Boudabousia marimammalium]|uniref:ABC transmembrane type-1 domain-containing protein n=1 Tax=Boudabousia marimammalium TaxID=156892 RepID=A0A1Q5PM11_9ACTO|nr:ABC transporter permease [Boudabousia marimammalium]OKL48105.1 hypothetical protein BM477_06510 [Boudabousia marimammalium]
MRPRKRRQLVSATLTVLTLFILWELVVLLSQITARTLPAPSAILASAWKDRELLLAATWATSLEVFFGMLIGCGLGVIVGVWVYASAVMRASIYPLLVAAQTIPIIAVAPLIMLWMGFTPPGKILLVSVYASFPVVAACVRGMSSVPDEYVTMVRTLGASPSWALWQVRLRGAIPTILSGIKISATYAFGTAAMSEYVGASAGLGVYLNSARANYRTDLVFATAFTLAVCTLILFALIAVLERSLVRWPEAQVG